jgi:hypothetical protein
MRAAEPPQSAGQNAIFGRRDAVPHGAVVAMYRVLMGIVMARDPPTDGASRIVDLEAVPWTGHELQPDTDVVVMPVLEKCRYG